MNLEFIIFVNTLSALLLFIFLYYFFRTHCYTRCAGSNYIQVEFFIIHCLRFLPLLLMVKKLFRRNKLKVLFISELFFLLLWMLVDLITFVKHGGFYTSYDHIISILKGSVISYIVFGLFVWNVLFWNLFILHILKGNNKFYTSIAYLIVAIGYCVIYYNL